MSPPHLSAYKTFSPQSIPTAGAFKDVGLEDPSCQDKDKPLPAYETVDPRSIATAGSFEDVGMKDPILQDEDEPLPARSPRRCF